jgi:regulator of protease activity HflC (stomatin/prohibitin superfamily)
MTEPISFDKEIIAKFARFIPILLILLFLVPSSFVVIDAGKVGVVKRLGAVQPDSLPEGFHFKLPFADQIIKVDVRLMNSRSAALSSSKDLQTVRTTVEVQYSINGEMAPFTYQKVGLNRQIQARVIEPAIGESVKAVTAQYTAEELVTKRGTVKLQIQEAIQNYINATLDKKKIKEGIEIANVAITDFNFSDEFNRAIEMKVKAEQEALQAKNEKIKRITQAEASASEQQLSADASAYEIAVASKARAAAIKREAMALRNNPELIQLRIAEKWDGKLPHFNGSSAIPFLNIDNKQN